jgi:DNA-binding NarL/FixJ family response regulator
MIRRILVADDNDRVRRGVAELLSLQPGFEVCGEAKDGGEALEKTTQLKPDVILLDVRMPGMSGLEVARLVCSNAPLTKILVMSHHDPKLLLPRVLAAGGHGCIDKGRIPMDLASAIENVCHQ